jgi:hypothetical protein
VDARGNGEEKNNGVAATASIETPQAPAASVTDKSTATDGTEDKPTVQDADNTLTIDLREATTELEVSGEVRTNGSTSRTTVKSTRGAKIVNSKS